MKLAAIDIGSNAVRIQISSVLEGSDKPIIKKIEYVRFPLRLGQDVFSMGSISDASQEKFMKLMQACKLLLDLFEVDHYFACATSAIRSAENGAELVRKVKKATGIQIQIIDGEQEASFIDSALADTLPPGYCLHIDVGGGSTELNLYLDGKKVVAESFSLGSVRNLQGHDTSENWQLLEQWVKRHAKKPEGKILAIGTGGNISKLYNMGGKKGLQPMGIKKLQDLRHFINSHSIQERINKLQLNPDRADVIIPAADIYLSIMRCAGCTAIKVPNIGLKDGLMKHLLEQQK